MNINTKTETFTYIKSLPISIVKAIMLSAYEAELGETGYKTYNFNFKYIESSYVSIKNVSIQIILTDCEYYSVSRGIHKNLDISFLSSVIRKHKLKELLKSVNGNQNEA
jgi:hypothetical protein